MVRRNMLGLGVEARDQRNLQALATATPLEHSAVEYGRTRFIGGELLGEGGAQQTWHGNALFDGNVQITHSLEVDGDTHIGGSTEISGSTTISGDVGIGGNVGISGDLDVVAETVLRGLTQLLNDLVVHGSGRIQVGSSMTLNPANASGALEFSNGAQLYTNGDSVQLYMGGYAVQVKNSEVSLSGGGAAIVINGDGIHMFGLPQASGAEANLFAGGDGRLGVVPS